MRAQSPVPRHRSPRAFALLIVIILLAFVVVLLVGLATYTRIESAVATNTQRQAQARQNALLGLNVALAQLQKYAGPDQRVTATAESTAGVNTQKAHYTGVWHTDPTATADALTPLAWLVSGAESATPNEDVTAAIPNARAIQLVGTKSAGTANSVVATAQDITATGVPGATTAAPVIGRYAWWVGDQGVKAPVAVTDTSAKVVYDPFGDGSTQNDLGKRLHQQIALSAGAADGSAAPVFEPSDSNNASLVTNDKISAHAQLAFLKNSANATIGLTRAQQNFHTWSPNNFAVLANTKRGGLRQDLSLKPDGLGSVIQGWLNYSNYMEPPVPGGKPAPAPDYESSALRRRYLMQSDSPTVAPVLTYFLLTFNIRTQGGTSPAPLEVRAKWMMSLWNPYTGALVPEDLLLEINGLPEQVTVFEDGGPFPLLRWQGSLQQKYSSPAGGLRIRLPWDSKVTAGSEADRASWLPGRVYTWTSQDPMDSTPADDGYPSNFYSRTLDARDGAIRPLTVAPVVGSHTAFAIGGATPLQITLYAARSTGNVPLAKFRSPPFVDFSTAPAELHDGNWLTFAFRLGESLDGAAWLTTSGIDPHGGNMPSEAFVYDATVTDPANPASFPSNYHKIDSPDRLLDRANGSLDYNEDVPIFELPRSPVLSLAELQHVALPGQRPFAIGNSWGATFALNGSTTAAQAFDGFFFSGLQAGVSPPATSPILLPNAALKVIPRKKDGSAAAVTDLQPSSPTGNETSAACLQGNAFNLNSTNLTAWTAVLRGVRFPAPSAFKFLDVDSATGSATDSALDQVQSTDAQFLRFAQSAQETYKTIPGQSGGAAATELFRKGMRTLAPAEVTALATQIITAIKARQATSGPFRSLEEFLSPSAAGAPSLLEQAIADAGLNANIAEFSSQWLTQGDIMTALAPVLFPRSDTFVIRAYGEALNPTTGLMEGRAWCEATVQRFPDYFNATADDATVPPDQLTDPTNLNQTYGRRFKVLSFRWLTRSDI